MPPGNVNGPEAGFYFTLTCQVGSMLLVAQPGHLRDADDGAVNGCRIVEDVLQPDVQRGKIPKFWPHLLPDI